VRLLGVVPGGGRDFESFVLDQLDAHRLKYHQDEREDYEVFLPVRDVIRFIESNAVRVLGYRKVARPRKPKRQTCRMWVMLVRGIRKGDARDAATTALREYGRLCKAARPAMDRTGGFDLNELIGGLGFSYKQTAWGFAEDLIAGKRWLVHRITYKDVAYHFPVFSEWYEREQREPAPPNAIEGGIPLGKPNKLRISAETRALRERRRVERKQEETDQCQLKIPGAA
jgi:hypothetical protein